MGSTLELGSSNFIRDITKHSLHLWISPFLRPYFISSKFKNTSNLYDVILFLCWSYVPTNSFVEGDHRTLYIYALYIQSALFITYRSGVLKANTLYFLRYFDITYFKVFLQKRQKIRYILYFPLWVQWNFRRFFYFSSSIISTNQNK